MVNRLISVGSFEPGVNGNIPESIDRIAYWRNNLALIMSLN